MYPRKILPGLFAAAFVSFFAYDYIANGPRAARVGDELSRQLARIPSPDGAVLVDHHATHKPRQALADDSYKTALSYVAVADHYDRQLRARGWQFRCESGFRDWGRDLGGRAREYTKGPYKADLQWAGERADYGWTFGISLSWGLSSDCR